MKCCINNYGEGLEGWGLGGLNSGLFLLLLLLLFWGYAVHITIVFAIVLGSNDYLSI